MQRGWAGTRNRKAYREGKNYNSAPCGIACNLHRSPLRPSLFASTPFSTCYFTLTLIIDIDHCSHTSTRSLSTPRSLGTRSARLRSARARSARARWHTRSLAHARSAHARAANARSAHACSAHRTIAQHCSLGTRSRHARSARARSWVLAHSATRWLGTRSLGRLTGHCHWVAAPPPPPPPAPLLPPLRQ